MRTQRFFTLARFAFGAFALFLFRALESLAFSLFLCLFREETLALGGEFFLRFDALALYAFKLRLALRFDALCFCAALLFGALLFLETGIFFAETLLRLFLFAADALHLFLVSCRLLRLFQGIFLFGGSLFRFETLHLLRVFRLQAFTLEASLLLQPFELRTAFFGGKFRLSLLFGADAFEFFRARFLGAAEFLLLLGAQPFELFLLLRLETLELAVLFLFRGAEHLLLFGVQTFELALFFLFEPVDLGLFFGLDALDLRLFLGLDQGIFLFGDGSASAAFRGKALSLFLRDLVAVGVDVDLSFHDDDLFLLLIDDLRLVGIVLFGVGAQIVGVEGRGSGVEIELTGGDEFVEDGAGIFVFRPLLFQETASLGGERVVAPSAAALYCPSLFCSISFRMS